MLLQTGNFPPAEVVLTDSNIPENQTSAATVVQFSSVQFRCSVMSNSLQSHGLQNNRLPCPPPTPRVCSNSVHQVGDAIQPSHPCCCFSFCLQSFAASGSFPVSQLFASGGQSTGASASASVLPMNIQD